jgi:hypothetical protein
MSQEQADLALNAGYDVGVPIGLCRLTAFS